MAAADQAPLIPGGAGSSRVIIQRHLLFEHVKRVEAGMPEDTSLDMLRAALVE